MIRNNLATRPFYNERTVRLALLAAAAVVALATLFNVSRIIYYSRSDTELAARASQDESRAAELRREATRLRASVDAKQMAVASDEARAANTLIDRRTFSWTALWNLFEATLPPEVRITSIRPSVGEDGRTVVTVNLLARGIADLNEFFENLDASGQVTEIVPGTDRPTESGLIDSDVQMTYMARPNAEGAAAAAESSSQTPAQPTASPTAGDGR